MESRLSRWLDGLMEACWLAAVLAIPLFFNIHSERVFEPDKIALLRSLALVMAAAWCVKFVDQRGWRNTALLRPSAAESVWHKPFALVLFTLIAVYVVSTAFSVNPGTSWAGSYQRLQGTYTTFAYIVIFGVVASTISTRAQVRRVVTVAIVTSIPVAFYGLLQHFSLDPLPWGGDVVERVAGQLGNAIFIAAYLIMVVPLTVARVVDAFNNILSQEEIAAADIVRTSVYIFTLAIQLLAIYWSGSRGPQIGLVVGLFAFVLILLVSLRDAASNESDQSRPWQYLPALLLLLPSLLALLLSKPVGNATSPMIGFLFFMGTLAVSMLAIFVMVAMGRGWRWLWLGWIALTLFAGLWLVGFNVAPARSATLANTPVVGGVVQALDEWRDLPTIGSYGRMLDASATTGREKSGRVRVLIWQGVVQLIRPHAPLRYPDGRDDAFNFLRPLLGYGPESMYVAYNRFYPAELATVEARNASPDRSHNETFDTLVITGLFGFLAWQALYLGVVYFAFRYLRVVRSRRDSRVFVGLLVGGALLAALAVILLSESIYLGVAIPTGVVAGIILYLIYYALAGRDGQPANATAETPTPFGTDRLLMTALVAAVLAHYVEIHFGIAISATRLYFFVYVALMVAIAYRLPRLATASTTSDAAAPILAKARRKPAAPAPAAAKSGGWNQLVLVGLLLALAIGIMGYSFVTYALPPGKVVTGSADLAAAEIFRQAFLQNGRNSFAASPFVFAMMILTWGLGWLIALSEMARHNELPFRLWETGNRQTQRTTLAAVAFVLVGAAAVVARLLLPAATDATAQLGRTLLLVWGAINLAIGILLLVRRTQVAAVGALSAAAALALCPAIAIAGAATWGLAIAIVSGVLLYLLWQRGWSTSLVPLLGLIMGSMLLGLAYTYLHVTRYHASVFFRAPDGVTTLAAARALEAAASAGLLTTFYGYVFLLALLMAVAIAWPSLRGRGSHSLPWFNTPLALVALVAFMALAVYLVASSNIRIVQADMIFKRARPFDDMATRASASDADVAADNWDAAIAIYNEAIGRAPREDFYYLFLGRALLERSGVAQDSAERLALLQEAEARLLEAQALNPLNTDHTANLARLYARWYGVAADDVERQLRLQQSEENYLKALTLSPQNSIIRNELAQLTLEVKKDCAAALALYDESATIDPFYTLTFLSRADAYVACGASQPEPIRTQFYTTAAASLATAVAQQPGNLRAWVQLAEVQREIAQYPEALEALEQARALNNADLFSTSELDFIEARIRAGMGDPDAARDLANGALSSADAELTSQIETFLDGLDAADD